MLRFDCTTVLLDKDCALSAKSEDKVMDGL